jgi:hypothetical protein
VVQKIDPDAYRERLERISSIFGEMVQHADEQSLTRCPYKDRNDRCTAQFGCRHRRPADEGLPHCVSDDALDYRSAWDTAPAGAVDKMRDRLKRGRKNEE